MSEPTGNPLLDAALGYARRGWPVFPCKPSDKSPLVVADKDPETGKPIKGTGGVAKATTDEVTIRAWWTRWPKAMIAVAQGRNGAFALDFDPREDLDTGEEWSLERLKGELEAQMGCALPLSATSRTPSGGVHVFFGQPVADAPIRNRGNLPEHVDVRGEGGYVIVPPSIRGDGVAYRWLRPIDTTPIAVAPDSLIEILRTPGGRPGREAAAGGGSAAAARSPAPADVDEGRRNYALKAFDAELRLLAGTPDGGRNDQLNASAYAIGQLVGAGALSTAMARSALQEVARAWPNYEKSAATIESGLNAGIGNPRDLSDVAPRHGQPARSRGRTAAALPARERSAATTSPAADPSSSTSPARPGAPPPDPSSSLPPAPLPTGDAGRASQHGSGGGRDDEGFGVDDHEACSWLAQTDLGNAERFLHRCGERFRYCEEHGWLEWVGTHWKRLDDGADNKVPPADVLLAVYRTIRAIGDEADFIAGQGEAWRSAESLPVDPDKKTYDELRHGYADDPDPVVDIVKGRLIRRSDKLRGWARASESAQKLAAVAKLARPNITVSAELFDRDPLKINVANCTLSIEKDSIVGWHVNPRPHDRLDYMTKCSPAAYDPKATCKVYDELMAWAQPKPELRRFLHAWGGLSLTALPIQKLVQHYGTGGNGKGTMVEIHAYVAGDYGASIDIATILNTGAIKDGAKASPDLARLPGVRMLRTSEPEENAKLAEALIKRMTGGDPIDARHLNRGLFTFKPVFKLSIQGNYKLRISGTDNGIWRRVRLVPWLQQIEDDKKDELLPEKLKAEASGILRHLLDGLVDYLENGLVEPEDVTAATADYRSDSDPLGRFLEEAVLRCDHGRVPAAEFHATYAAWAASVGEGNWSMKHLNKKMKERGFEQTKSSGMFWIDIELTKRPDMYEPLPGAGDRDRGGGHGGGGDGRFGDR